LFILIFRMSDNEIDKLISASNSGSPTPSDNFEDNHDRHSRLLRLSLESYMHDADTVSADWIDTIGDLKNNPRKLSTARYNDGSYHWVDRNNNVLSMAFPAVLNIPGKYSKIGPYFNLMGENDVKVCTALTKIYSTKIIGTKPANMPALTKMKAVFDLSPLTVLSSKEISQDAIGCSTKALNVLQTLYQDEENKRNGSTSLFFFSS
jgi:hypothetical protein